MAYNGDTMHYNGSNARQHTLQGYMELLAFPDVCDLHKQDVSCPRPKCSAGCTHTPFVFNQLSHACLQSSRPSYLLSEELEQLR